MRDSIDTVLRLSERGVPIYSIDEPSLNVGSKEMRGFFCKLLSWLSRIEQERLRARIKEGIHHSHRQGKSKWKRDGRWGTEPKKVTPEHVQASKENDVTDTHVAAHLNVSLQTLYRRKRTWRLDSTVRTA